MGDIQAAMLRMMVRDGRAIEGRRRDGTLVKMVSPDESAWKRGRRSHQALINLFYDHTGTDPTIDPKELFELVRWAKVRRRQRGVPPRNSNPRHAEIFKAVMRVAPHCLRATLGMTYPDVLWPGVSHVAHPQKKHINSVEENECDQKGASADLPAPGGPN